MELKQAPKECRHDRLYERVRVDMFRELEQVPSKTEITECSPSLPDFEFVDTDFWFVDLDFGSQLVGYMCLDCAKQGGLDEFR